MDRLLSRGIDGLRPSALGSLRPPLFGRPLDGRVPSFTGGHPRLPRRLSALSLGVAPRREDPWGLGWGSPAVHPRPWGKRSLAGPRPRPPGGLPMGLHPGLLSRGPLPRPLLDRLEDERGLSVSARFRLGRFLRRLGRLTSERDPRDIGHVLAGGGLLLVALHPPGGDDREGLWFPRPTLPGLGIGGGHLGLGLPPLGTSRPLSHLRAPTARGEPLGRCVGGGRQGPLARGGPLRGRRPSFGALEGSAFQRRGGRGRAPSRGTLVSIRTHPDPSRDPALERPGATGSRLQRLGATKPPLQDG